MKEETIKTIKENLTTKVNALGGDLSKAAFLVGARQLNLMYYDEGIIETDEYLALDKFMEVEIDKVSKSLIS